MALTAADEAEFDVFVRARLTEFTRTAYLLCSGSQLPADDLVQLTLARLMKAWPRLSDRADLDSYVKTIMVRVQRSWHQRLWTKERLVGSGLDQGVEVAFTDAVDDADVLRRALCGLSTQQRAAVVLRFYADCSEQEVASMLGCSRGAVKTHTSRGLAKLRGLLNTSA